LGLECSLSIVVASPVFVNQSNPASQFSMWNKFPFVPGILLGVIAGWLLLLWLECLLEVCDLTPIAF